MVQSRNIFQKAATQERLLEHSESQPSSLLASSVSDPKQEPKGRHKEQVLHATHALGALQSLPTRLRDLLSQL